MFKAFGETLLQVENSENIATNPSFFHTRVHSEMM